MKIKAAIFEEVGKPLVIDTVDLDGPREHEVLVRLSASGVCHTDWYTWSGADPSGYWPAILGHEGAGVVEEVGPGVAHLAPGDHVVPFFKPHCGACAACLNPVSNHCTANDAFQGGGTLADGTSRIRRGDEVIRHYMGSSTFAEACVVHVNNLVRVDPRAPLDKVCLLGCGITTGVGAALWTAKVRAGATCAVFGCGGVGMSAIQGCRIAGAGRIIAVDLSDDRLELSKAFGATDTVKGGDDAVAELVELTGGGVDYAFEATGNVAVMTQALEAARRGTGVCCICGVAGKGEAMQVVPRNLITGKTLIGSSFGGAKGRIRIPELVDWYLQDKLDIDRLATKQLPLEGVNEAFAMMERQEGFRTVLTF